MHISNGHKQNNFIKRQIIKSISFEFIHSNFVIKSKLNIFSHIKIIQLNVIFIQQIQIIR